MRSVLDTSVLIDPPGDAVEGDLAISSVSLAELHYGVLVARTAEVRAERLQRVGAIERAFAPLPVDDAVARAYGRVSASVVDIGRSPRPRAVDLLIAATALAHDARCVTRNPDDFAGLSGLVQIVAL